MEIEFGKRRPGAMGHAQAASGPSPQDEIAELANTYDSWAAAAESPENSAPFENPGL
jgi:hypothetical protein